MIPQNFIQDLLARSDIVDVVGRHVQLKKAGINFKGLCPFHGEKTPSFIVSPTRQTYHCFGCGVHGNAIGFLMEHGAMGFIDAVKELAQQVGLQVPDDPASPEDRAHAAQVKERQLSLTELLAKAAEHYKRQLKGSPRAIDYLKRRGLTGEIAARFALGYAPEGWRSLASAFPKYDDPLLVESGLVIVHGETEAEQKRYDRFRDRIMFPIRGVRGEVIGFGGRVLDQGEPKYLNSPETPVFVKGRELYGLYEARQALRQLGFALVVEGYMDVVALSQLGFPNAVATLGTACTAEHVHKLFRFTDQVVFSFDGDAAGRRAAIRALEAALPHATDTRSIKFLFLPAEHDPDSYVREFGRDAFARCIGEAVPLSRQLIGEAREGCDLATAEGRARMLAHARPLWSVLPAGALKQQLLGELAALADLGTHELLDLWQPATGPRPSGPPAGEEITPVTAKRRRPPRPELRAPRHAPSTPADRAAQYLLEHPAWWDPLSAEDHRLLCELPDPHGALFRWLDRQLTEGGPQPWSALREGLRGEPFEAAAIGWIERPSPTALPPPVIRQAELRIALEELHVLADKAEADRLALDPSAREAYVAVFDRLKTRRLNLEQLRRSLISPGA